MSKFTTAVNKGDKIFDNSETELINAVNQMEPLIFDELIKILNTLDVSNGKLITNSKAENFLMSMDAKIYRALQKADYNSSVLKYTKNFNLVADNIKEIHSVFNNINITDAQINPFLKIEVNSTIDKLTGSGMAKDFINPVRESLYRNIMLGAELSTVEKTLKDYVVSSANGDSKLLKYVKQVGRSSIQQFDGTIQANIAKELDLNAKRYVGSLIIDSRAQCRKWVTENNGIIMVDDLAEEIRWAFTGSYQGQKCSGMIPGTTVDTFDIFKGGYGPCRHRSIPTMIFTK